MGTPRHDTIMDPIEGQQANSVSEADNEANRLRGLREAPEFSDNRRIFALPSDSRGCSGSVDGIEGEFIK